MDPKGHLDICQLIISNVKDKNPADDFGYTPLHLAISGGHLEVCMLIVESVKDKNPGDNFGNTPLHWAADLGHFLICQLMLDNAKDKNPKNNLGSTPLHYAAAKGNVDFDNSFQTQQVRIIWNKYELCWRGSVSFSLYYIGPFFLNISISQY